MAYKNITNFYRIPVMGQGDVMTEQQNWKQMSIVDNLLYAATFGCSQCFLQEGKYQIDDTSGNTVCHLLIKSYDEKGFSLMGIINYRMFYSKNEQRIGPLYYGLRYYIYIEYDYIMQTNPQGFSIKSYTQRQDANEYRMLLCIIDADYGNTKIDTDVNKVYSKNILAHVKDNTNPHGVTLYQDNVEIFNQLTLNNYPVYSSFYTSYITNNQGQFSLMVPNENMQIVFATAYPESLQIGEISWKIIDNMIYFNNSIQKQGIKVNVKLDLRRKKDDL